MNESAPLLSHTEGGISIRYKNRQLYPTSHPREQMERRAAGFVTERNTLYLLPSPLLGYGLSQLKQKLPQDSYILALEADQALHKITDLQGINPSDQWDYLPLEQYPGDKEILTRFPLFQIRRVKILSLSGGYMLNRQAYQEREKGLQEEINRYWKNKMTLIHMGRQWITNIFRNLPNLAQSRLLQPFERALPMVLAGAGEGLEEALPLLQASRGEYFLLAVDTALPTLAAAQLAPDAVLALESQFYNLWDFYGSLDREIPLIGDLSSYPPLFRYHKGPRFFVSSLFSPMGLWDKLRGARLLPFPLPPLGSVGVSALWMARYLNKGPLFLCGFDFAYTPGKTHAKEAPTHKLLMQGANRFSGFNYYGACLKRPLIQERGKKGRDITTDLILSGYHKSFLALCREDTLLFDLTRTGLDLQLPYADEDSFKKILEDFDQIPPAIPSSPSSKSWGDPLEWLTQERDRINTLITQLKSGSSEEILALLKGDLDYLYCYFPDEPWKGDFPPGFLNRLLASAVYFRREIEKLL